MKNKKNIVVFIDWFTPGYKAGGPVRSCVNLIEQLKDDYDFYVITGDTDYGDNEPYKNIVSNKWSFLEQGVNVFYFSKNKISYSAIKKLVLSITNVHKYYLNGIFSYHFTFFPLLILRNKDNVILAPRGMLAKSALSIKPIKKNIFIKVLKMLGLFENILFQATSSPEETDIKLVLGTKVKVRTAPNLLRKNKHFNTLRTKISGATRLLYLARISPEKNLLYALNLLKNVKGEIIFDLFGTIHDKDYWKKCEDVISLLPDNIVVSYKGVVSSPAVYDTFQRYDFLFLPTLGENFGHSIIESISLGCPVIISDQTPWKNLQAANLGWDLPLKDQSGFVKAIEQCVKMDNEEYLAMSRSAISYAEKFVKNTDALKLNNELFE